MKRFGTMLDMSRNAVMKPEEVKRFAKTLASFGYNMIMLYTEDTYEVDGEPYFGYLRGRYSKDEMKDIVSYCASIGVEVIPCVQTLAHLGSIFRWTDFSSINDFGDILLIGEERTYELIENMISTLRQCFDTPYIHIGMDEAHMVGLGKYLDKHGFPDRFELLVGHVRRLIEICAKYNFKPIMWSDMFFRLANGGEYYPKDMNSSAINLCPKEIGLVYWDYYKGDKDTYDAMLDAHKKFGNEVWFAGGCWSWEGFAPYNRWSIESMSLAVESCRERDIDNIFFTMWGDNGKECSYYSLLPSLYLIRRYYEGEYDIRKIKDEFRNLTGESFDAMMSLDVPNYVAGNRSKEANPCKHMLYSDPFLGFLDSTCKDGVAEEYKFYSDMLTAFAEKSKSYGYIFESEAALCSVLELKYDLGKRTREAYKSGNMAAIEALIPVYTETLGRLEVFYERFQRLWMKENKPHGFDVQDLRLGALMQRLKSCRARLLEYIKGEADSIPELEEDILEYKHRAGTIKGTPHLNSWIATVSVNNV